MAIKHAKNITGVPDDTDTNTVSPTDWNADHLSPDFMVMAITDAALQPVWTNMPAALTELRGVTFYRTRYDMTQVTQARIVAFVSTVGSANAQLRVQYSTDASTWAYLDGSAGPAVAINAAGTIAGAWVTLAAAARVDAFLRIIGINGDGVADPVFGSIHVWMR